MAIKAQLVELQELLALCCVVCGVSLRENARTAVLSVHDGTEPLAKCQGRCVYPVVLEAVVPGNGVQR